MSAAGCGTYAGARAHQVADEPLCEPCRRANRAYRQARYRATHPEVRPTVSGPALRPSPGEWAARGLCDGADPELFFSDAPADQAAAKKVCAACPVLAQCLGHAMTVGEPHGVWGGLTARERALRRTRDDLRAMGRAS